MGLDVRIIRRKAVVCPHCGGVVGYNDDDCVDSGGRAWYPFLESIGYYVPYEERTEENDWYGKDMVLTAEQADELYRFVKEKDMCGSVSVVMLIAAARYESDDIVINADW